MWDLIAALVTMVATLLPTAPPVQPTQLPSEKEWAADVRTAMYGSHELLRERVTTAKPNERLAINLDIDNTSLASTYAPRQPIVAVQQFAQYAHDQGVAVLFNTGRDTAQEEHMRALLTSAGYPVDGMCTRHRGEHVEQSKQRCRRTFVAEGYTIVANVGNRDTDFIGRDFEMAFVLPSYGDLLN